MNDHLLLRLLEQGRSLHLFGLLAMVLATLFALFAVVFVALPLLTAIVAYFCSRSRSHPMIRNSILYTGRVWHTRLYPKKHAFTYPIFMFALDLEELDAFRKSIWPLSSWIVQFRERDHLKNGEGLVQHQPQLPAQNTNTNNTFLDDNNNDTIAARILRLVAQKTEGKFQPTLATHRVVILTHLSYYGYNFNPVSFYYVVDRTSNEEQIAAVVGEVSNTPWTEMYCYVLHPDSTDRVKVKVNATATTTMNSQQLTTASTKEKEKTTNTTANEHEQPKNTTTTTTTKPLLEKVEYSFPKEFHVSPFMEMDYWYDWTFIGVPGSSSSSMSSPTTITVINTLRRRSTDRVEFTAKLVVDRNSLTPWNIVWQMIRLPIFCLIIQVWIHYQAALLFAKGIVYVPHPQGSETTASTIIATVMIPFFALRDLVAVDKNNNPKGKMA
mmetsp:Transcript_25970/g.54637  ORF Transcript_25970/g.54637 Transcript_25970/m.54637 type:complete len:439 (+) Transcript_25970:236-1552(+)